MENKRVNYNRKIIERINNDKILGISLYDDKIEIIGIEQDKVN